MLQKPKSTKHDENALDVIYLREEDDKLHHKIEKHDKQIVAEKESPVFGYVIIGVGILLILLIIFFSTAQEGDGEKKQINEADKISPISPDERIKSIGEEFRKKLEK